MAAAVSSQEVSIPSTFIIGFSLLPLSRSPERVKGEGSPHRFHPVPRAWGFADCREINQEFRARHAKASIFGAYLLIFAGRLIRLPRSSPAPLPPDSPLERFAAGQIEQIEVHQRLRCRASGFEKTSTLM